ncbi:cysteine peptidase family C39 domain-containing protein [Marinomonas sp. FW-1]|uniref:cysteine peptidase family C39 domain-containing protein n=1 Tax=Marinomonas sp. FW-1 TaxID=2071621 RepID=UPI0010C0CD4A
MKRVIQEDSSGCGIACIAMLTDTKYSIVKEVAIDILNLDEYYGLYTSASNLKNLGSLFALKLEGIEENLNQLRNFQTLLSWL